MSNPTSLEQYRQHYFLSSVVLEDGQAKMIIDQHQRYNLDVSQPIYLIDMDHTILNTTKLKHLLAGSLAEFNISPQQWDQTYAQAKTSENYYDFNRHLELLSQLISPVHPIQIVPAKIQEFLFATINKAAPELIYANFSAWLQQSHPRNMMIMTSGTGEWQRQKIAACLVALNWEPQSVILIQNTYKGWVVQHLYQLIQSGETPNPRVVVIDDNVDELEDIAKVNPDKSISLYRIKQPDGQYNQKPTTLPRIIEIDCVSQSTDLASQIKEPA